MDAGKAVGTVVAVVAPGPLGTDGPAADAAGEHVVAGFSAVVLLFPFRIVMQGNSSSKVGVFSFREVVTLRNRPPGQSASSEVRCSVKQQFSFSKICLIRLISV